jgi:hypothetical protein
MVSKACYKRLWNLIKFGRNIQILNFPTLGECACACVGSASDEIVSAFAQPAMKFVPRMLSFFWMMVWNGLLLLRMLIMCENWLLDSWACAKTGYLLAEHAWKLVTRWLSNHTRKLVTHWLSKRKKYFAPRAFQSISSIPPVTSPVPFSYSCLTSYVTCLTHRRSLSPVLCPLSYVSIPCLMSSVPCLKSLFLVSRPLYPVSRDLARFPYSFLRPLTQLSQCPLFCGSIPLFLSFVPLFTVLCSSVSRPLFLCSSSHVLCPLSHVICHLSFTCEKVSFLRKIQYS